MPDPKPRPFWTDMVGRFEDSGLTQPAFARKHGLKLGTFRSWIYRLRRERKALRTPPVQPPASFVEVEVPADFSPSRPVTRSWSVGLPALVLRFTDDVELRFTELPSPEYIAALSAALGRGRC